MRGVDAPGGLDDRILSFWNGRSTLGETAGTDDFLLSRIERDFLCEFIPAKARILDVGCGVGAAIVQLAQRNGCTGVGVDYSDGMIAAATKTVQTASLGERIAIHRRATPPFPTDFGQFDFVYSQRCLINYTSTALQRDAVRSAVDVLTPGGAYVMIECSKDGGERTNVLRRQLGLEPIEAPWHNLFLSEAEVATWGTGELVLERLVHITSTYHFLSRVVYAKLAHDADEELRYDSPINTLAAQLPRDLGEYGPVKAWIWRRKR